MSRGVVAKTAYQPEGLTPLVRRDDGFLQPAPAGSVDTWQPQPGPAFPVGTPGTPSAPSWMEQETILPGFKNSTVAVGLGLAALAIFLATRQRQQVIA